MAKYQIKQIMPANDWFAIYLLENEPYFEMRRLVSFAIVENENGQNGLDGITEELTLCITANEYDSKNNWYFPHFSQFKHKEDISEELKDCIIKNCKDIINSRIE